MARAQACRPLALDITMFRGLAALLSCAAAEAAAMPAATITSRLVIMVRLSLLVKLIFS
jgi:hypothetical protein